MKKKNDFIKTVNQATLREQRKHEYFGKKKPRYLNVSTIVDAEITERYQNLDKEGIQPFTGTLNVHQVIG